MPQLALGLGLQKSGRAMGQIFNKPENLMYADKTVDGVMIDRNNIMTFDPVRPAYLVGEGATYFQIEDEDGVGYTDADLPINYTIEWDGIFKSFAEANGLMGFSKTSVYNFQVLTTSSTGNVEVYVGPTGLIASSTGIGVDDSMNVKITKQGGLYTLYVNDVYKDSDTLTATLSNNILQIMTRGEGASKSKHSLTHFKITDTDTGESYTLNPQALGTNDFIKLQRSSTDLPELYAQQYVAPEIPLIYDDSLSIGSPLNEDGYILADGSTHYMDEALTTLYPLNTEIQRILNTTKADAYIDVDGVAVLADCDLGPIKTNVDIVDVNGDTIVDGEFESGNYWSLDPAYNEAVVADKGFNEVGNPEFEDGTDDWGTYKSTLTASSNILSVTGTGGGISVYALSYNTLEIGDTTFAHAKARVTNSDCTRIDLRDGNGVLFLRISNPVINQWYDIYGIISPIHTSLEISHSYADAATANGKVMEVQGSKDEGGGVIALNLTEIDAELGTSYASMTAEEVNAIKYSLAKEYLFKHTDPTAVERKLLPCDTANRGDYLFTSLTKKTVAVYDTPQTGDTLTNIKTKFGIT